jgi:SAM-dependent methyltransferase
MGPEGLTRADNPREVDLQEQKYAEAYEEMAHYNQEASQEVMDIEQTQNYQNILKILRFLEQNQADFPFPKEIWLDATYTCVNQWEAYAHLGDLAGKRLLQVGGKGTHAVKFLLAGAQEVWLITPMIGEIRFGRALARKAGVADRFRAVAAFAEEIPFEDNTFDAMYSGGCVHHMDTLLALPECARVLKPQGRFAAADPWSTSLYEIGIKLFGKREKNVHCRPLTPERITPLYNNFNSVNLKHHGGIFYYFIMALQRLGFESKLSMVWKITKFEDFFRRIIPWAGGQGPQVTVMTIK